MGHPPHDELDQVSDQVAHLVSKLWQWHHGDFCPVDTWAPPINLYRLERRLEVCVDLAGVDRKSIDVNIEPGQLVIRGIRHAPEPPHDQREGMRILAMEIDHGRFCRTIELPNVVDLPRVESEYKNGLLWIRLPLRDPG